MEKNLIPELRFPEFSEEWEVKSLDDIATITMGQSPKSNSYNTKKKGVPLIQGNSDITNRKSDPLSYTTQPTKVCSKNDLILSVRAPVGHIAVSKHDACIGRGVCSISSSSNLFLYYYLLLNENKWAKYEQGSTFKAINSNDIRSFKIKIPLATEQRKISSFFSKLDEKIDLQKNHVDRLKIKKKGLMQRIFSREVRFKDENGNDYPEWEEKKLEDLIEKGKAGGTPLSTNSSYYNGDIPFLSISDMTSQGKYLYKTEKTITEEGLSNSSAWLVPKNSLIYSMYASIGFVSINKISLTTSQAMYSMIINNTAKTEYLYYYLTYIRKQEITRLTETGTQGNFNAGIVRNLRINLPSKIEQEKISNILSKFDEKIKLEENLLKKYEDLKKGLMQKMFV